MKRALVVSFLAALGLAIAACDDGTGEGKLTNGNGDTNKLGGKDDGEETKTPVSEKKSDTSNPVTPPAQPAPQQSTPPAPAKNPTDCSAQADLKSCATCCATNNNPANACACGAGAKCADKCTDNLCTQKTPSLQCILCLGQSGCDFGFGGDGNGGGGAENSPAAQCLQQCNTKFGGQK